MICKNDCIRLLPSGKVFWLAKQGNNPPWDWPPPEIIEIAGFRYRRIRCSALTDAEAQAMPVLARGAEYEMVEAVDDPTATRQ